jgi:hypothetical protein
MSLASFLAELVASWSASLASDPVNCPEQTRAVALRLGTKGTLIPWYRHKFHCISNCTTFYIFSFLALYRLLGIFSLFYIAIMMQQYTMDQFFSTLSVLFNIERKYIQSVLIQMFFLLLCSFACKFIQSCSSSGCSVHVSALFCFTMSRTPFSMSRFLCLPSFCFQNRANITF